ncbi:MAG: DUF934 domain-containing protein [Pseudomonadota bacterium]
MPLLKNGDFGTDPWVEIEDDAPLPAQQPVIVPLARLQREDRDRLVRRAYPLGVKLTPDDPIEAIEDWLGHLDLVALEFPKFTDGRAYSSAQILRQRYGFKGEIRAVGDVLVDQYQFMRRCGFNTFLIVEGRPMESWRKAQVDMTLVYQADDASYVEPGPALSIFEARRHRRAAVAAE